MSLEDDNTCLLSNIVAELVNNCALTIAIVTSPVMVVTQEHIVRLLRIILLLIICRLLFARDATAAKLERRALRKLLYAVASHLPLAHTRARGSFVSRSFGGCGGHGVTALPLRSQQDATLPVWRPARRLGARRHVKEQVFFAGMKSRG